jgi:hypothetical protein
MGPLSEPKGVVLRDHFDVVRCKVLFVNLLQAKIVSMGTVAEMAWKWHIHGPIVLVMEKTFIDGSGSGKTIRNIHDHMFITQMATYQVETLDEGIILTKSILKDAV